MLPSEQTVGKGQPGCLSQVSLKYSGIKNFVVQLIIQQSQSFENLEVAAWYSLLAPTYCPAQAQKAYVAKLNMTLVQVLKQEWPSQWPSFIPDLVGSSKTSESLCMNNMDILRLLSEEVFDFSKGVLTQVKAQHLKDTFA